QTSWRTVASWRSFWTHTPGWHLDLTLRGAIGENDYKDAVSLLPQAGLPTSVLAKDLGPVKPSQAVSAEEAFVGAFFGRWLRGQASPLLDGPSPRYPQIAFVRSPRADPASRPGRVTRSLADRARLPAR